MTKDEAFAVLWEARDGLISDKDTIKEMADAFKFPYAKVPYKDVEALRREGIYLEQPGETIAEQADSKGVSSLYVPNLPAGVLACEFAEALCGMPEPKIYPFADLKKNAAWRTERALVQGHGWNPTGPGRLWFT